MKNFSLSHFHYFFWYRKDIGTNMSVAGNRMRKQYCKRKRLKTTSRPRLVTFQSNGILKVLTSTPSLDTLSSYSCGGNQIYFATRCAPHLLKLWFMYVKPEMFHVKHNLMKVKGFGISANTSYVHSWLGESFFTFPHFSSYCSRELLPRLSCQWWCVYFVPTERVTLKPGQSFC